MDLWVSARSGRSLPLAAICGFCSPAFHGSREQGEQGWAPLPYDACVNHRPNMCNGQGRIVEEITDGKRRLK